MKLKPLLITAFIFALLSGSSCTRLDKILTSKEGTWLVQSREIVVYVGGVAIDTFSDANIATYVFEKEGTGTYTDSLGTMSLTWMIYGEDEGISICEDNGSGEFCYDAELTVAEKTELHWNYQVNGTFAGDFTDFQVVLVKQE